MGTVSSFSGSGSKQANDLRDDLTDWLDRLPPPTPPPEPPTDNQPPPEPRPPDADRPRLNPDVLLNAVQLLRPRSAGGGGADGPGGGGGGGGGPAPGSRTGGGASRSVAGSAGSAGRAGAGVYAFLTGDTATLERLGLDYNELSALGSSTEVARRIVAAACSPQVNSTVVDHEQRLVAADVADWMFHEQERGALPTPEEIARYTIAAIIAETAIVESGKVATEHDRGDMAEDEIREAAEALAARATLSVNGATEAELAAAIESGIETLRRIRRGSRS